MDTWYAGTAEADIVRCRGLLSVRSILLALAVNCSWSPGRVVWDSDGGQKLGIQWQSIDALIRI